jgi:HK97 family phage major capsid protein
MKRSRIGTANHIDRWPLGLDASITPTPAGYKLGVGVTSVKTGFEFQTDLELEEAEAPAQGAAEGSDSPSQERNTKSTEGNIDMDEAQIAKAIADGIAANEAKKLAEAQALKAAQEKEVADKAAMKALILEVVKEVKLGGRAVNAAAPAHLKSEEHAPAINKLQLGEDGEGLQAFNHWLKTGDNGGLRADSEHYAQYPDLVNPDAIKAAFDRGGAGMKTDYNIFGDTQYQGAELVPTLVYNKVIELRDKRSIARLAGAQVLPVGSKVMNVPIEKDRSGRFVIQAAGTPTEGGTFDPNAVQILDKKVLTMYDFTRTIEMSRQILDDSVVQLEAWWNRHLARMEAVTENYFFIVGTGTLMPLGALYGGATGKTLASASTITAAEVIQLFHSMKQQYRNNTAFVATAVTMGIIRALAANYAFSFIPTPSGSLQDTFVAGLDWIISPTCHVYESDDMPEFGNGTKPISLGNYEEYLIGERQALSVFRDPYSRAKYGDVCFHCLFRRGGSTVTNEAFKNAVCVST